MQLNLINLKSVGLRTNRCMRIWNIKDKILGVVGTFKSRQHHLDIGDREIEVKLCIVFLLSRQLKEHPTYKKSSRNRSVVSKLIEAQHRFHMVFKYHQTKLYLFVCVRMCMTSLIACINKMLNWNMVSEVLWISSMLILKKPRKLCICIDPRDLNKAIKRSNYIMPTLGDI